MRYGKLRKTNENEIAIKMQVNLGADFSKLILFLLIMCLAS